MIEKDMLARALDRLQPVLEAGETALPTIHCVTGSGPFRIMLAVDPADMQTAFERARSILVFKSVRSLMVTGQTGAPEGLYAALINAGGGAGLFRGVIREGRRTRFAPDQLLPKESVEPMFWLCPTHGEALDRDTEAKVRSIISLHGQLEDGLPLVIRS